jgi:pyruvate kinase
MIEAGVDVVRLNFSHGKAEDHVARAALVREIAAECGRVVAVMADLQGPKIRIGKFADGKIELQKGDHFILDAACELGNQDIVGLDYKELPADLKPADVLLLNDGLIVLVVDRIVGSQIFTTVKIGGELSNLNKKIVFYRANCENFASMLKIIKNVDVVCHAAAYAHEGLSVFSPSLITKNIIAGSSSVLRISSTSN